MNTFNCIPFELDDGTVISECLSICRYLEGIYPSIPLLVNQIKNKQLLICGAGELNSMH